MKSPIIDKLRQEGVPRELWAAKWVEYNWPLDYVEGEVIEPVPTDR